MIRECWDGLKRNNERVIDGKLGKPSYKETRVKDIIAEKCTEIQSTCTHIQDAQRVLVKREANKNIPRHILIRLT